VTKDPEPKEAKQPKASEPETPDVALAHPQQIPEPGETPAEGMAHPQQIPTPEGG
jgi:hypothetical protein